VLSPLPSEHRAHPRPAHPRVGRLSLRRPLASVVVLVGVGAIALGACGTPPKTSASGPTTTLAPGAAPLPGVVTTAPAVPPSTFKPTPECAAMNQFQLLQFGAMSVPAAQQQAYIASSNASATTTKAAIPELTAAITVLDDLLPKSVVNATTQAEKDSAKQASETLAAWWSKTCQ